MTKTTYQILLASLIAWNASFIYAATADERKQAFPLTDGNKVRAMILTGPDANRVEQTAIAKLVAGIKRDSGITLPITRQVALPENNYVIIGTTKSNPELARLAKVHNLPLGNLGDQDFVLRTLHEGGKYGTNYLLIAGGGPRGVLYGTQEALDQVITASPNNDFYVTKCDIKRFPALSVRGTYCLTCWRGSTQYPRTGWEDAIDSMADAGMNRVMFWMDGLFRSKRHPGAFLNKPEQQYHKTPITHDDINKLIDYAHDRGMDFYFASGVFGWFTAGQYIAKQFPEVVTHEGTGVCPSSPVAQRVTLEYLSEMIEVYPQANGYMLEIRDELGECMCATCRKPLDERGSRQYGQSELDFLEKLTATVWAGHPKTKFTWLIGYPPHKEDVLYYQRIREMGRDPRMEWLEVRNSWTLPSPDGGRKPLREFSDRVYHWGQYYRFSLEGIQGHARRTRDEGLDGFLPAYEPGFNSNSVYSPSSPEPFPVRQIPFCMTQFYYHTFTWEPDLPRNETITRAHQKFFTAEVPRRMAEDLFFIKDFMATHLKAIHHYIGVGLGPKGCGLLCTADDIWTADRPGGVERKIKLFKGVADDIRRFIDMIDGTGQMARIVRIEKQIADLRPHASRRSIASFDIMQRAIDIMRAKAQNCDDYIKEAKPALKKIEGYLKELEAK